MRKPTTPTSSVAIEREPSPHAEPAHKGSGFRRAVRVDPTLESSWDEITAKLDDCTAAEMQQVERQALGAPSAVDDDDGPTITSVARIAVPAEYRLDDERVAVPSPESLAPLTVTQVSPTPIATPILAPVEPAPHHSTPPPRVASPPPALVISSDVVVPPQPIARVDFPQGSSQHPDLGRAAHAPVLHLPAAPRPPAVTEPLISTIPVGEMTSLPFLPPPVVRRAFIAALQAEAPPVRRSPWVTFFAVLIGVLVLAALAYVVGFIVVPLLR